MSVIKHMREAAVESLPWSVTVLINQLEGSEKSCSQEMSLTFITHACQISVI